jgi:hypothetical protein
MNCAPTQQQLVIDMKSDLHCVVPMDTSDKMQKFKER